MKKNALCVTLFGLTLMAACAPMQVKVDHDQSYDFKKHLSYNIVPNTQDDLINLPLEKSATDKIVTETIDRQLANKGYQFNVDKPDMLISYYLVTNTKTDVFIVNQYYNNMGFQQVPGRSSTRDSENLRQSTYEEGILIIDVIDTSTNVRVWRGHLSSRSDVYKEIKKKEQRLEKSVSKVLSYLPAIKTE